MQQMVQPIWHSIIKQTAGPASYGFQKDGHVFPLGSGSQVTIRSWKESNFTYLVSGRGWL